MKEQDQPLSLCNGTYSGPMIQHKKSISKSKSLTSISSLTSSYRRKSETIIKQLMTEKNEKKINEKNKQESMNKSLPTAIAETTVNTTAKSVPMSSEFSSNFPISEGIKSTNLSNYFSSKFETTKIDDIKTESQTLNQNVLPTLEGIVWKRRDGLGKYSYVQWERRRLVLSGNSLIYYALEHDIEQDSDTELLALKRSSSSISLTYKSDPRGIFYLLKDSFFIKATSGHHVNAPTPFVITIVSRLQNAENKWKLCFETHKDMIKWSTALMNVVVSWSICEFKKEKQDWKMASDVDGSGGESELEEELYSSPETSGRSTKQSNPSIARNQYLFQVLCLSSNLSILYFCYSTSNLLILLYNMLAMTMFIIFSSKIDMLCKEFFTSFIKPFAFKEKSFFQLERKNVEKKLKELEKEKKDRNSGHQPGKFTSLKLDSKDESSLKNGKPVMTQIPDESGDSKQGGRAICIQDVEAPKSAVWNQILDFDHYSGKVSKLKECKNYLVKKNDDGTFQIKTKMVVSAFPGYNYEYYCDHTYYPKEDSICWSLDYDKLSDFDDVAGHWHVEEHPEKKGCSRVFYACDIKFRGAVPGPVMNVLTKVALKSATAWVKRESESLPNAPIPSEFAFAF